MIQATAFDSHRKLPTIFPCLNFARYFIMCPRIASFPSVKDTISLPDAEINKPCSSTPIQVLL